MKNTKRNRGILYAACLLAGVGCIYFTRYLFGYTLAFAIPQAFLDAFDDPMTGILVWDLLITDALALTLPLIAALFVIRRYSPQPAVGFALVFLVTYLLGLTVALPLWYGPPIFVRYITYQPAWYQHSLEFSLLLAWVIAGLLAHRRSPGGPDQSSGRSVPAAG